MKETAVSAILFKIHLERECQIYQEYFDCVNEERKVLSKFDSEKIEASADKRLALSERMSKARDQRIAMVKSLTGCEKTRLTDAMRAHYKGSDQRELLALANRLKSLITKTRKQGLEFNQIVNFAMNIVNGTLSLFSSATQHVTRSYSPKGIVKESFHPQGHRHTGVIKEA